MLALERLTLIQQKLEISQSHMNANTSREPFFLNIRESVSRDFKVGCYISRRHTCVVLQTRKRTSAERRTRMAYFLSRDKNKSQCSSSCILAVSKQQFDALSPPTGVECGSSDYYFPDIYTSMYFNLYFKKLNI